jgi:hypothetical protein
MIELKGIAPNNNNFSQKSGTNHNKENQGATFSVLNGGSYEYPNKTQEIRENKSNEKESNVIETSIDIITYDLGGKILKGELFSGINVDIVI